MSHVHDYDVRTTWQGNRGAGTASYRGYDRAHVTVADGRPELPASSDPAFRGDAGRWNPELLLVAALSQCHLLSYLHCCAVGGVVVTGYEDAASGRMEQDNAGGHFVEVTLRPKVTVSSAEMVDRALKLHHEASERCFIASSVNFPVRHEPEVVAE